MSKLFTLCNQDEDGEYSVIRAGLTAAQAIEAIAEDGGRYRVSIQHTGYEKEGFRVFDFRRYLTLSPFSLDPFGISATVPCTKDLNEDKLAAMKMIETQVLFNHRLYWKGHVFTDDQYAEKMAVMAERRRVADLDRLITGQLMSALIADGYSIRANIMDDVPQYQGSTNVEELTEHLLEYDEAEIAATKNGERAWMRLIFGESGWDVAQDYTCNIEHIVDAVITPHLPWNQPCNEDAYRGYDMYTLPAPNDATVNNSDRDAALSAMIAGLARSLGS